MSDIYRVRSTLLGSHAWLGRAVLLALLLTLSLTGVLLFTSLARGSAAGLASFSQAPPSMVVNPTLLPSPTPVVVEEPAITPGFTSQCESSYWYRFTNSRLKNAYLTLNVNLTGTSTNQGIWRPDLLQDGIYKVEAFIPIFPAVESCDFITKRNVVTYTADARYTIEHGKGKSVVAVSQDPLANEWVSLGEFPFRSGTTGLVTLGDKTGEATLTRGVVFSALRFTWITETVFAPESTIHLPLVRSDVAPRVRLTSAWTAEAGEEPMVAFVPGEAILLRGKGSSSYPEMSTAEMNWQVSSPCGPVYTFKTSSEVEPGTWTRSQPFTLPANCTGVYSYTLTVTSPGIITRQTAPFVVNLSSAVLIPNENQAAFDKCNIDTLPKMSTWWKQSPYFSTNLYVGGVHRGCANTGLNAFWVSEAAKQGWKFIPTWVGPQPPCSSFRYKFSSNPSEAYIQGRTEAENAFAAVDALGLGGSTVIYYDIEATPGASTSCVTAIQSFLSGWTRRLHEYGSLAGAYGAPCSSVMKEWANASYPPDAVWIASWYPPPYAYDPNASVFDRISQTCLPNTLWANYQRLRQYNNTHTETWGGVAFTIDSNVSLGPMSFLPQAPIIADKPAARLQSAELVAPDEGWALSENRLLWSNETDGWRDITPAGLAGSILNVHFSDPGHGWLVSLDEAGSPVVYLTTDGSATWHAARLPDALDLPAGAADLASAGSQNAWIALNLQSSSNFSLGSGFRTRDGGLTWEAISLPAAGRLSFLDEQTGWLSGGPGSGPQGGSQLYVTRDGGQTWQLETLGLGSSTLPGETFFSLPAFRTPRVGLLAVSQSGGALDGQGEGVILYETQDGGRTWMPARLPTREPGSTDSGMALIAPLGENGWALASPESSEMVRLTPQAALTSSLPGGVLRLDFAGEQAGWALVQAGACTGLKPGAGTAAPAEGNPFQCETSTRLVETTDGGQNWIDVTP